MRLFQQISLAGGLLALFVIMPVNIAQGFSRWLVLAVTALSLLAIELWRRSRKGHHHPALLILGYLACLNICWFTNNGSHGPIGVFFIFAVMMLVIFLRGRGRVITLLITFGNIIGLYLIEYFHPSLVSDYATPAKRIVDMLVSSMTCSFLFGLTCWIIIDDFRRERRHLQRAMEELRRSTQQRLDFEAAKRGLEQQVEHLQGIESLGRLAGGVAHDMNNILAAITSAGEALQLQIHSDSKLEASVHHILRASTRGRHLVAGLLNFARKDMEARSAADLNQILRQEAELLGSTTLQRIHVELDLQEGLPPILADANAISNAIMNLCINAADAMPNGGTITIQSRCSDGTCRVSIRDTGVGMGPDIIRRIREPFFTTKPQGKGTGLGLSIVLGIVESHGGTLDIESKPGHGTCATLRFPVPAQVEPASPRTGFADLEYPPRRILLVDDDDIVRETAQEMLLLAGHTVTACVGGQSALAQLAHGLEVDLVILDMNMPQMSGEETLRRLRTLRPQLEVIIATGYTNADMKGMMASDPHLHMIAKPYSIHECQRLMGSLTGSSSATKAG